MKDHPKAIRCGLGWSVLRGSFTWKYEKSFTLKLVWGVLPAAPVEGAHFSTQSSHLME